MKNLFKVLGIIAIVAVIGFSMAACGEDPDSGDPSLSGNITITVNGSTVTTATTGDTLTANYSGSETVSYQWRRGTISLGTAQTQAADEAGSYTVTVSAEGFAGKTSAPVTVTVRGGNKDDAIPLTLNQWADGNLPTSSDVQWFSFEATASTQYIHVELGTLTYLRVWVCDSNGAGVGRETDHGGVTNDTSRSLTVGEVYYIRVMSGQSNLSGTYKIGFTTSTAAPSVQLPSNAIPLTANQWEDGNLPTSSDVQWFSFEATASTHIIHTYFGTLTSMYVNVYNSSGTVVGNETGISIDSNNEYTSQTGLTVGEVYYIRVRSYASNSGTYKIGFTTSTAAPSVQLPSNAIPLTANQWEDGNLPTPSDEQWFSFEATADTQYIHVSFGTLTGLYVRVYDSSGAAVGSQTHLVDSFYIRYTSRTLTAGQTYYIRVRTTRVAGGTYRIGFTTSTAAPTS